MHVKHPQEIIKSYTQCESKRT